MLFPPLVRAPLWPIGGSPRWHRWSSLRSHNRAPTNGGNNILTFCGFWLNRPAISLKGQTCCSHHWWEQHFSSLGASRDATVGTPRWTKMVLPPVVGTTISTKGGLDTAGPQFYRKLTNVAPTNGWNTILVVLDLQNWSQMDPNRTRKLTSTDAVSDPKLYGPKMEKQKNKN